MFAAVDRILNLPVIGAGPNLIATNRRSFDVEDRVVVLRARYIVGNWATRRRLMIFFVARQVGTDHGPVAPAILRLEDHVSGQPTDVSIPRRKDDRRIPIEAILCLPDVERLYLRREIRLHEERIVGRAIIDDNRTALRIRPEDIRIERIRNGPLAVSAVDVQPVLIENA